MMDQEKKETAEGFKKPAMLDQPPALPPPVQIPGLPAVGPQETPGPASEPTQAGAEFPTEAAAPTPERPKLAGVPAGPQMVHLDPTTILRIELLSTKQQLAARDEQLAKIALAEAQRKRQTLAQEEQALMADVSKQIGRPISGDFRLIDKEKGICQVG